MELIKKLTLTDGSFDTSSNIWRNPAVPSDSAISTNPVLAAQQLNDDLLQSILVSLHCATPNSDAAHRSFEGKVFKYDNVIIFGSPVIPKVKHYSNTLAKISTEKFIDKMSMPVYRWIDGSVFFAYPLSLGVISFQDFSRFDPHESKHNFILIKFNNQLFECPENVSRIDLLSTLCQQIEALPDFLNEDNPYSVGFPKLIENTRVLLNNSASSEPRKIVWDSYWNIQEIVNNGI